jgi:hypothetical protein
VASQIAVKGLADFQRDLRGVDPRLAKTLQVAHKKVSSRAVEGIRPAVGRLPSPGSGRTTGGITPRAGQKYARVAFSGATRSKPLHASILGANWHPVFGRFIKADRMRRRLWQPHLGATWSYDQLYGAGPVFTRIADTFALDEYADAIMDSFAEAFPERT